MGFFDFIKGSSKSSVEYINVTGGMRLNEAKVDIMFIVQNNQLTYINKDAEHLFKIDKDGDKKLEGRIVKFIFRNESKEQIEIFVAFDEQDSYTMFTLQAGLEYRLNYVANSIFQYFHKSNILHSFISSGNIQVQFEYTFKLYNTNKGSFMVNNSQSQAYVVIDNQLLRSNDRGKNVDSLKELFWN